MKGMKLTNNMNSKFHNQLPPELDFKCGTFKTDESNGISTEIRTRMNADEFDSSGLSNYEAF